MLTLIKEESSPNVREVKSAHATEHRAIIRELFERMGDDATLRLVWHLNEAPARLSELRDFVVDVSQRKFSLALRQLIRNGFVARRHSDTFPSWTIYSLTPMGIAFLERVTELAQWIDAHGADIKSARSRFGKRSVKMLDAA
ncbi:helix-turn-helix transcriptional regulator [Nordella sp. HKS 07]|uniref:winged helix-turn-helix transcriptional regulator n=1 Tax=Nordella sp. HKS 07 TaxID=2712222 RepID=UPI0013E1E5D9|nr:helix-turn-helix domain-containing protein [Nordella sp. HKS 07]QIG47224.1 helix-turn-helix transcriptional regulator [Nordella sp. HKS 07]